MISYKINEFLIFFMYKLAVNPSRCAGVNKPNKHLDFEELISLFFQHCSKGMFLGFHFRL